jgi:hypothetical protein
MIYKRQVSKYIVRLLMCAAAVWIAGLVPTQGAPVLTLDPASGMISGTQGETIGWGFTITNTANYLEVTSSAFCLNPVSTPFCTPPTIGAYTDIISSESTPVVVGPSPESTSVTQSFNAMTPTGVGSFQISGSAVNGSTNEGEIVLTYDLFSVSPNAPNFNPTLDTISTDNFLTTAAGVAVSAVTIPEPGPLAFVAIGLAALIASRWRAKQFTSPR